jgi:hypothetical protein
VHEGGVPFADPRPGQLPGTELGRVQRHGGQWAVVWASDDFRSPGDAYRGRAFPSTATARGTSLNTIQARFRKVSLRGASVSYVRAWPILSKYSVLIRDEASVMFKHLYFFDTLYLVHLI